MKGPVADISEHLGLFGLHTRINLQIIRECKYFLSNISYSGVTWILHFIVLFKLHGLCRNEKGPTDITYGLQCEYNYNCVRAYHNSPSSLFGPVIIVDLTVYA
jgi:hypothetical protein